MWLDCTELAQWLSKSDFHDPHGDDDPEAPSTDAKIEPSGDSVVDAFLSELAADKAALAKHESIDNQKCSQLHLWFASVARVAFDDGPWFTGPLGKDHVRINVATQRQTLDKALRQIADAVNKLKADVRE